MKLHPYALALLLGCFALPVGASGLAAELVDGQGQPLANAVLSLKGVGASAHNEPAIMDQRDKQFMPTVLAVRSGTSVKFPNSDDIRHHVYSFSKPNAFALPLYKGSDTLTQHFTNPGVVVLGCNIHDSMLGYILVVDSSRSGLTGADGRVVLPDVPAGTHPVRAWAPGLDRGEPPEIGAVTVGTGPASASLRVTVPGLAAVKKGRDSRALAGGDY